MNPIKKPIDRKETMADRKKKPTKAGAVELGKEDLEAISGGPTAVEYAVMLSVKREDKAKGDRPKGLLL